MIRGYNVTGKYFQLISTSVGTVNLTITISENNIVTILNLTKREQDKLK